MDRKETAIHLFKQGYSCSQAVFAVYASEGELDDRRAMRLSSGFGGGMGRTNGACGVVTGAVMVLGLMYGPSRPNQPEAKERVYGKVQEFVRRFVARNKSVLCSELLGCDLSQPEGLSRAKEQMLFVTTCPKYVGDAVEILEQMLAEDPPKSN